MINPPSTRNPDPPSLIVTDLKERDSLGAWSGAMQAVIAHRVAAYIAILLVVSIAAYGYGIRTRGIFACPANGYSADRYLADCSAVNFADYEHGAFQFNLEPQVQNAVRNADVLFLGNSRVQVAFSAPPTERWFSQNSVKYYLMGFGYYENALFEGRILAMVHPKARVYIINLDSFFQESETPPVATILHDPRAKSEYEAKRMWQRAHERICGIVPELCGHQFAIFRSRSTGMYYIEGQRIHSAPISYDLDVNQRVAASSISTASAFLSHFGERKCVILTMIPTVDTQLGTAKAIATGIGLPLITPLGLHGLQTWDGSHLDRPSAQRWSEAFFRMAGPEIRSCLDRPN